MPSYRETLHFTPILAWQEIEIETLRLHLEDIRNKQVPITACQINFEIENIRR